MAKIMTGTGVGFYLVFGCVGFWFCWGFFSEKPNYGGSNFPLRWYTPLVPNSRILIGERCVCNKSKNTQILPASNWKCYQITIIALPQSTLLQTDGGHRPFS